ncbi:hypothetical protein LSH36_90g01024, partial [Paralvinella palmiformis]
IVFSIGDTRVNEFVGLTTQHTVWAREHNRIEAILNQLNPHWNGPRLFEETRRIVTAMWQWVVFNEYLPVILGPHIMRHYGIVSPAQGYSNGYQKTINPSVANSFATAAMRFGHTQIQGIMEGKDVDYTTKEYIPISTVSHNNNNDNSVDLIKCPYQDLHYSVILCATRVIRGEWNFSMPFQ